MLITLKKLLDDLHISEPELSALLREDRFLYDTTDARFYYNQRSVIEAPVAGSLDIVVPSGVLWVITNATVEVSGKDVHGRMNIEFDDANVVLKTEVGTHEVPPAHTGEPASCMGGKQLIYARSEQTITMINVDWGAGDTTTFILTYVEVPITGDTFERVNRGPRPAVPKINFTGGRQSQGGFK